jgi:hypothetical protein
VKQLSSSARKLIGRTCFVVAIATIGWALVIYPIAFEYAAREARAAGEHKLGAFPATMADFASGWFTAFLIISAATASASLGQFRDVRFWRISAWAVVLASIGSLAVHALHDGPVSVADNLWAAVTHPTSFHWPVDYFRIAVQHWGAWP